MIGISKLLCDGSSFGDSLRYKHGASAQTTGAMSGSGPVVVWNCTRTCNLKCIHCYSASQSHKYVNELTTAEARMMIDDLVRFRVPALLISGGEPLVRRDILDVAEYATERGLRVVFSTNGLLVTKPIAQRMRAMGVSYVGISFDGIASTHDKFRGQSGAFARSVRSLRILRDEGQKVGIRFTINRFNVGDVGHIFDMMELEQVKRVCFYHLVYSGRGAYMRGDAITHEQSRAAVTLIAKRTEEMYARGLQPEVLTVDNHADGIYIYLELMKRDPERAQKALELLECSGGNRSGIAISCIDNEGYVLPDQFMRTHRLGNVREQSFGEIWENAQNPLLAGLRDRKSLLRGRCRNCKWLHVCNGNFRARAEAVHKDIWAEDPACYLTNEEIGLTGSAIEDEDFDPVVNTA